MSTPYWLEEEPQARAALRHAGRVDVAVVGGGVTGCACALALAQAGLRVRLHEGRRIASGASGRNGGFALRGAAPAYDVSRLDLGAEAALALWELTERTLDRMEELAGDSFRRVGSLRLAVDAAEAESLRSEYEALRRDGFEVEWMVEPPPMFAAAVLNPRDASLTPARWVRRLAARAAEAGAELVEESTVLNLVELDADQIVIATDGYTRGLVPELDAAVQPVRNQVIVTEPLSELRYPRPHYARVGWDYWQQLPDRRLVVGGRRDAAEAAEFTAEEAVTPPVQTALERLAEELVGAPAPISHRWSGIFGLTADRYPLAGRLPGRDGLWVAAGYSGHGNVLGFACGRLVAGAIIGRPAPELALFDPRRVLQLEPR